MKILLILSILVGCSHKEYEIDNEFAEQDLQCLEAEFDNDRSTVCK